METSPSISDEVKNKFMEACSGGEIVGVEPTERQLAFLRLHKPEICDALESTMDIVYKPPPIDETRFIYGDGIDDAQKSKCNKISSFIYKFEKERDRAPTIKEVISNLEDDSISVEDIEHVFGGMTTMQSFV